MCAQWGVGWVRKSFQEDMVSKLKSKQEVTLIREKESNSSKLRVSWANALPVKKEVF